MIFSPSRAKTVRVMGNRFRIRILRQKIHLNSLLVHSSKEDGLGFNYSFKSSTTARPIK